MPDKPKKILISPLEWGLGHAGRCIPLAAALKSRGYKIVFGAGKRHLAFLTKEFPDAETVEFPGFNPTYSKWLPMWLVMLCKLPSLICHAIAEHLRLPNIIRRYDVDVVLSDNRFGMWNKSVTSIYMTHQLCVKFPKWAFFLEPIGAAIHRSIINRYDYCLVPDLPGEINLSGRLSHCKTMPKNVSYVGILSRFAWISPSLSLPDGVEDVHDTVILSGPEPQKSLLKEKLMALLVDSKVQTVFLGAEPECDEIYRFGEKNIFFGHLPSSSMKKILLTSRTIFARSGYSTIMELVSIGRDAVLIPTPGQTEQEYLANDLETKGWFTAISQKRVTDIKEICCNEKQIDASFFNEESDKMLTATIDKLFVGNQIG